MRACTLMALAVVQYCRYLVGTCGGTGQCDGVPQICTLIVRRDRVPTLPSVGGTLTNAGLD